MPDWSYRPLLGPLLGALSPRAGRAVAARAMGGLAALPLGAAFIEAFGDMAAPETIRRAVGGVELSAPTGIGGGLDVELAATSALVRFGAGYLEIGPVTGARIEGGAIERDDARQAIALAEPLENPGIERVLARVRAAKPGPARLAFCIAHARGASVAAATNEACAAIERLGSYAAFFTLDLRAAYDDGWSAEECERHVTAACARARTLAAARPILLCIAPDANEAGALRLARIAVASGACGVSVSGGVAAPEAGPSSLGRTRIFGAPAREATLARVRALRRALPASAVVIAEGGVAEPGDALALFDAGATLVQVQSGIVFAGPGLVKRVNEAVAAREPAAAGARRPPSVRARWAWCALYAAGLLTMSVLVLLVGVTRVVLPYDELFLGISRARIDAIDPRLIPFMIHDRVTVGGTTLAIGSLYLALALFGVRRGERWAWRAVALSSWIGFASYWLWLRLGYFDPLHALATVLLLPLFLSACFTAMSSNRTYVVDANDAAWRRSLVAQLLLVIVGIGFIIGGATIAAVGVTNIFVQTDLAFLQTTPAALNLCNVHLIPVIAHDRAGFGGALVAEGVLVMLVALWGFGRGRAWLWRALAISGVPLFVPTIAAHAAIGYTAFAHLAPVYFALALFAGALALSHSYLTGGARASVASYREMPVRSVSSG